MRAKSPTLQPWKAVTPAHIKTQIEELLDRATKGEWLPYSQEYLV